MFDTIDEIRRQLKLGESSRVEFKELRFGDRGPVSPNTEDMAAEMCAFANAEGGALFLGVAGDGSVPGVDRKRLDIAEPYRTFTRNQLLVSFLSRMRSSRTGQHYLESRGEGVRKILAVGEAHSGRRPAYELFGSELRLTIWGRGV